MVCPWRRSEEIWNIWRNEDFVDRVYGGAILRKKRGVEPKIEKRQLEHYEEKKAIGQRAVDLVEDGEVIAMTLERRRGNLRVLWLEKRDASL